MSGLQERMKTQSVKLPNICTLDIETSPNVADVWGLWNQNVGINQIRESSRVICFAAKWYGVDKVEFWSEFHHGRDGMIRAAHAILDRADIIVTYNGVKFDLPHLRREFFLAAMNPPSPWQDVDLLRVVRRQFKFPMNKLDYITQQVGIGAKTSNGGHTLWTRCLEGDPAAWKLMKKYNKQDVRLTEKLYDKVLPWITGHPHVALYTGETAPACSRCGSLDLTPSGHTTTPLSAYQQYKCNNCGSWHRGSRAINRVDVRGT